MKLSNMRWDTRAWHGLLLGAFLPVLAWAGGPDQPQTHTLAGVVVDQQDGKPIAGARVAMAHSNKGYIFIENKGELHVYGPEDKVLFFLSKRNGKTACDTTTDAQGRFKFESFTSLSAKYTVVASSKTSGMAILQNICPNDYAKKPLKIEINAPAYLEFPTLPKNTDDALMTYINLRLEPVRKPSKVKTERNQDAMAEEWTNVYLGFHMTPGDGTEKQRMGPLVGGRKYRVGRYAWSKRFGSSATLYESVVEAQAGKTLPVTLNSSEGATLTGHITTKEGSPLRDVNVMLKSGDNAELVLGALTDEKGGYTIANAPVGKHKLELLRYAVRVGPG